MLRTRRRLQNTFRNVLRGNTGVKVCVAFKEVLTQWGILWESMCTVMYWAVSITENSETE